MRSSTVALFACTALVLSSSEGQAFELSGRSLGSLPSTGVDFFPADLTPPTDAGGGGGVAWVALGGPLLGIGIVGTVVGLVPTVISLFAIVTDTGYENFELVVLAIFLPLTIASGVVAYAGWSLIQAGASSSRTARPFEGRHATESGAAPLAIATPAFRF